MKDMKDKIISGLALLLMAVVTVGDIIACTPPKLEYKIADQGTPVVMTINGDQIHANEFAAYMIKTKAMLESQYAAFGLPTDSLWNSPQAQQELQSATVQGLEEYHVYLQKFKELGLQMTPNDVKKLDGDFQQMTTQYGGDAKFQQVLQDAGYTHDIFYNMGIANTYKLRVKDYYYGKFGVNKADVVNEFDKKYICAKHVLLATVDTATGKPLSAEKAAAQEKLAQDVLQKAKNGEDFDALVKQYGEDPGMKTYPKGYVFTAGEMMTEFYNAAAALKDNEVSGIVKTSYGYHIIKRLPLDESRLDEAAMGTQDGSTYRDYLGQTLFATMEQEWVKNIKVTKVDAELQKITLSNMKEVSLTGSKPVAASSTGAAADAKASSSTAGASASKAS